ncbi:MAG: hypothetical protein IKV16_06460, partial [Clostridia bacterium]|nr:hypothetical protein [Clostridia bacterium]
MRKFSKILTLLLVLVMLVTAFTVVSLADENDEAALAPVRVTANTFKNDFESLETGFLISQTTDKDGVWYVGEADNGNKYAVAAYDDGTGTNGQNWDSSINDNAKLGLDVYPVFSFDFDVRSTTGEWHWALTMRADFYGGPGGATARLSQTPTRKLNKDGIKVTAPADVWVHVTYVVEHAGDGIFNFVSYVNGERTSTVTVDYKETNFGAQYSSNSSIVNYNDLVDENGNFKYSNVRVGVISMYPPSSATTEEIHFDNLTYTYFPEGYTADDASKYVYGADYQFPYGYTEAKVGDVVYDDVNKAFAAAEAGDTVVLAKNADSLIVIDKAITIDSKGYTFDWASYNGYYLASSEGGVYTFAKAENTVTVNWDPACDGACDCNAAAGGHSLNAQTIVVAGSVPAHPVQNPAFNVTADYQQAVLLGWSYENDGTVDELVAAPEGVSEITLYPVYDTKTYSLEVTKSNGEISYHDASEFKTVIEGISNGATLKLVRDVYVECATMTITKSFTLDLNGHKLERYNASGKVYEATKADDDSFVFGTDTVLDTVSASTHMFSLNAGDVKFTITSSAPGAALYNTDMVCDTWMYEGEMVKRTATSYSSGVLVYMSYKNTCKNFKFDINNVSVYSGGLWYQDSASLEGTSFNVEKVNFYRISGSSSGEIISSRTDAALTINITDSFFYAPAATKLMYVGTNNNKTIDGTVYVKNSDFIKKDASYSYSIDNRRSGNISIIFDNCRVYDMEDSKKVSTVINGTLQRIEKDTNGSTSTLKTAEGFERVTTSVKIKYTVPTSLTFEAAGTDIQNPTFSTKTTSKTITFDGIVTKAVDVNWVDVNGNTIKTDSLMPGVDDLTAPRSVITLADDDYKNILAQWVDAKENGKALTAKLGLDGTKINWQDSYTFYAVESLEGKTIYTGGIKDVLFNLAFTSNFRYNLYLPERDTNITFNEISGLVKGELVKVGGVEYRVYSYVAGTAEAAADTEFVVNFTVNGETYDQIFKLSALLYADIVLSISDVEVEKLAIGNMARYIMEACKATDADVDEKRINNIIELAGVTDYAAEYKGSTDIGYLYEYFYSVSYVVSGGAASYKFVINDPAYADILNFKLGDKELGFTVGGTVMVGDVEKTYIILDTARIYDIIDTLTITVDGTELSA